MRDYKKTSYKGSFETRYAHVLNDIADLLGLASFIIITGALFVVLERVS